MSTRKTTERNIPALHRDLLKAQKRIATERDRLRALIDEAEGLDESCERASNGLQDAIDALSELV